MSGICKSVIKHKQVKVNDGTLLDESSEQQIFLL